jgi:hypothetical protein
MDDLKGNENRARIEKAGVHNRMSPANAVPPTAADASGVVGRPMGPGILNSNSVPMMKDAHAQGRRSFDNMVNKPPEKPRSHYAAEDRRRLNPGSGDTYK